MIKRSIRRIAFFVAMLLLLPPSDLAVTRERLPRVTVKLTRIAKADQPVDLAARPGDDKLYVATRFGKIHALPGDRTQRTLRRPVLDIGDEVETEGLEPGLLGIAFSADGRRLFVAYTAKTRRDKGDVDWTLAEYKMRGDSVDETSRRKLIVVRKDNGTHNGGDLAFGPDGYLYVSLGDGAPSKDRLRTGQDPSDLLASILRIDPRPSGGEPYSIPRGNPFEDGGGAPEVWLYGVRNPWRFSFAPNGDLWVSDAGEHAQEEITLLPRDLRAGRGANLGWSAVEGTKLLGRRAPPGHVPPLHVYPNSQTACAVIGGYVYRGAKIAALRGAYVFTDLCHGKLMALTIRRGKIDVLNLGARLTNPTSFGEDARGDLYVLSLAGGIYRLEAKAAVDRSARAQREGTARSDR